MKVRHAIFLTITLILLGAVSASLVQTFGYDGSDSPSVSSLANTRDFFPATSANGVSYAVDGGHLFASDSSGWRKLSTPDSVIVSAVAVADGGPSVIYIGAANQMAIYRSDNAGRSWLRIPLDDYYVGGVTDIAVDSMQHLVYVGTDTAGLFRLRDVGSSMILSGQLLLEAPVRQVVADSTGAGMAFARTDVALYRAENYGLTWYTVDTLLASPTTLALADSRPPLVYVGTIDRGILKSADGLAWAAANSGLSDAPDSRLQIDVLAADPIQSNVLYAAVSYLYGSTELHRTPSRVVMSTDGGYTWSPLAENLNGTVAELLPQSGSTGAVFALTTSNRTLVALGEAVAPGTATATVGGAQAITEKPSGLLGWITWIIAGSAALALLVSISMDLGFMRRPKVKARSAVGTLPIRIDR